MRHLQDEAYFSARADQERAMTANAANVSARVAHANLAKRYETLAAAVPGGGAPKQVN